MSHKHLCPCHDCWWFAQVPKVRCLATNRTECQELAQLQPKNMKCRLQRKSSFRQSDAVRFRWLAKQGWPFTLRTPPERVYNGKWTLHTFEYNVAESTLGAAVDIMIAKEKINHGKPCVTPATGGEA